MPEKVEKDVSGSFFQVVNTIGNCLEKAISIPVFIFSIAMTITVLLGVFYRYLIRSPLGWT